MSPLSQLPRRPVGRSTSPLAAALGALLFTAFVSGCGEVSCPESLTNIDGVCENVDRFVQDPGSPDAGEPDREPAPEPEPEPAPEPKPVPEPEPELCDGVDNDGDDAVDEDWPELGGPCGESQGECEPGKLVCAPDGGGVVCEGEVGPTAEVCDGKDNDCDGIEDNGPPEVCDQLDNDCDGFVDEGVLAVKQERFGDHATVSAVDRGFVLARVLSGQLRVETYGTDGMRTGHHDDIDNPSNDNAFLESDTAAGRVLVAFGKHQFYVLEAQVDSDLVPIILRTQALHDDWDQGIDLGIYHPPYHPRVSASPPRFVGNRDIITFALTPFGASGLLGLRSAPTPVAGLPYGAYFDAVGAFLVWEHGDNVRAAWLQNDGALLLDIDIARGTKPAIAMGPAGPAVAFLREGQLMLSELAGVSMQCVDDGFCNEEIDAEPIDQTATTVMTLALDEARDQWFVAASEQLLVVGRGNDGPLVQQSLTSRIDGEPPERVDAVVSGGTAAIVQTGEHGDSVLTFMGCF